MSVKNARATCFEGLSLRRESQRVRRIWLWENCGCWRRVLSTFRYRLSSVGCRFLDQMRYLDAKNARATFSEAHFRWQMIQRWQKIVSWRLSSTRNARATTCGTLVQGLSMRGQAENGYRARSRRPHCSNFELGTRHCIIGIRITARTLLLDINNARTTSILRQIWE